jgi:hypothetical protein
MGEPLSWDAAMGRPFLLYPIRLPWAHSCAIHDAAGAEIWRVKVTWKFDLRSQNGLSFRPWIGISAVVFLSGCSAVAPFSAAPRLPQNADAPPLSAPPPPPPDLTQAAPHHRQYYDQKRRRYYYFDPVKKQYFWEDGAPK